jgi:hypothetical protein
VNDVRLEPKHHTIIATGVAEPGGRTGAVLREILSETLERRGLDPAGLAGTGDGFRYLIPSDVARPHAAFDPFVGELATGLRAHREAGRLRLRVAVHSGVLYAEPGGAYTGVPLTECARLLEADAGRDLLAGHPEADLVLLLTDPFYRDVVGSGTSSGRGASFNSGAFRPILVDGSDRKAWAYVSDVVPVAAADRSPQSSPPQSSPPQSSPPQSSPTPVPAVQASSVVWIAGDRHTFNGPIVGGDYRA